LTIIPAGGGEHLRITIAQQTYLLIWLQLIREQELIAIVNNVDKKSIGPCFSLCDLAKGLDISHSCKK